MAKIWVAGAGGWGLGLALAATRAGHAVTVWSCFEEEIRELSTRRESSRLLPDVMIPPQVAFTTSDATAAAADVVLFAVPSLYLRQTARRLAHYLPAGRLVISATKGIEEETGRRMSEILLSELPGSRVVVLSGPTHAEEVARGLPTSIVSASKTQADAEAVQDLLMQPSLRVYVNTDPVGVEYGGALKNVIALAAGICDGLNAGDNCKAALMTRGLSEMVLLGERLGARRETFYGLAGVGDLIVTCGSVYSRNHRAGVLIGKGLPPEEAVRVVGTVEGYFAVRSAHALAERYGVEMPITRQCYNVCYRGAGPRQAVEELMGRKKRQE